MELQYLDASAVYKKFSYQPESLLVSTHQTFAQLCQLTVYKFNNGVVCMRLFRKLDFISFFVLIILFNRQGDFPPNFINPNFIQSGNFTKGLFIVGMLVVYVVLIFFCQLLFVVLYSTYYTLLNQAHTVQLFISLLSNQNNYTPKGRLKQEQLIFARSNAAIRVLHSFFSFCFISYITIIIFISSFSC